MSTNTLITRTSGRGLDPNHVKLLDRYGQIVATLRQRLDPEHAALLAEPTRMGAGFGSDIAWYAEGDVDAVPLSTLPPETAKRLEERLDRLRAGILALAETLSREGEASQDLATALRAAMRVPNRDCLWAAGDQPILVDWGRQAVAPEQTNTPKAGALIAPKENEYPDPPKHAHSSAAGAPSTAASLDGHVNIRRRVWSARAGVAPALWILLTILLVLMGDRLLHACGVGTEQWPRFLRELLPQYCIAMRGDDAVTADVIASLESQIRASELALTRKVAACEVSCPVPPPLQRAAVPASTVPIQEEINRRLPSTTQRGQHLEITLTWEGSSDLDLHVTCPDGSVINYQNAAACGGKLVADLNSNGGNAESKPVEHVIWADAPPASGSYKVAVALYKRYSEARLRIPFHVAVWHNGRVIREERGEISSSSEKLPVLSITSPLD